jgi:hypothetical protein
VFTGCIPFASRSASGSLSSVIGSSAGQGWERRNSTLAARSDGHPSPTPRPRPDFPPPPRTLPRAQRRAERFIRTLKENFLWVHTFDTIEELRRGLQDFVAHYNATWLVARHDYRTPNQIRTEQRSLAQCLPANLPLAA